MNENQTLINWYPGHMAKTKRLLQDQIRRIDLIIELCDARLPFSSRNPDLDRMISHKRRLLFLNKSDMADPDISQAWIRYFRKLGTEAYLTDAVRMRGKETIGLIERATKEIVEKALEKGVRKTVRAMIVGIPNVGKSTLINRLYGRSVAQIGDRPGVTKSNQWVKVSPYLELLDTPGLLWPRLDDQAAARRLCYIGCIKDDVVDLPDLTIHLLEELCETVPQSVKDRFRISDTGLRGAALLDAVCAGRGWLLKGAQYDYDRCCSVVLDEFRAGKLGRITMEKPPEGEDREKMTDGRA
ncbi:MAG: ribosome biogenesis GTPase YlqF [Clostridia bacterium]|nr:ribosome biogenesis GTPase YlqF [Clostridia bacterium]